MKRSGIAMLCAAALIMIWPAFRTVAGQEHRHDVLVVGAGISGLSAAWELARGGFNVAVIEMSPHYGGAGRRGGTVCPKKLLKTSTPKNRETMGRAENLLNV
jgi:ribulose 1,5-bisphosphate synthetase/thiazole synthase